MAQKFTPQIREIDGVRYYQIGNEWYPSVTSILHSRSQVIPYVQRSRASIGSARARGTEVHRLADRWLHGYRTTAIAPEIKPFWTSIQPALKQIKGPLLTEKFIWHRPQLYAGTFDCLGTFRGLPNTLIDYKTCADPSKLTKAQLRSYSLQLCAYAGGIEDTMGIDIGQAVLLICHPEGRAIEIVLSRLDLTNLWPEWVALRQGLATRLETRQAKRSAISTAFQWRRSDR
jgi:hypothetical protein